VTPPLKLSEILFSLQDYMTKDGALSSEQTEFYKAFRERMNAFEGDLLVDNIEQMLLETREHVDGIPHEDFIQMAEAVLNRYRNDNSGAVSERIRSLAAEQAANQAAADSARLVEEARLAEVARLAEESRLVEEARLAEAARLAEESRLVEEVRVADVSQIDIEARVAEGIQLAREEHLAEQERLAEEARLAAETLLAEEADEEPDLDADAADEEPDLDADAADEDTDLDAQNALPSPASIIDSEPEPQEGASSVVKIVVPILALLGGVVVFFLLP
jgi:hypothetical protein